MAAQSRLDGATAIVTGASAGIGRATVRALANEGVNVVLAARREDRLEAVAGEVRETADVEALVVPTDVTDETAVEDLVATTVDRFDRLDVLVNNAGLVRGSSVEDMTTEEYRTMMATNVDGMFFTTRAALPYLRETDGTLVFIGSFAGQYPRPFNPVYAATKWWTRGFAQSVAAQVGDDDIAVTTINPSEVRTEFGPAADASFQDRFEPGEVTEPEEIAEAVVFAATRSPSMASEIDLYRRDKYTGF